MDILLCNTYTVCHRVHGAQDLNNIDHRQLVSIDKYLHNFYFSFSFLRNLFVGYCWNLKIELTDFLWFLLQKKVALITQQIFINLSHAK
jgi:hypothetical protein